MALVRVKDTTSGHEFDIDQTDWRIGSSLELVKSEEYPPTDVARPPKYNVKLGTKSGTSSKEN